MKSQISYELEDAFKRILRQNGVILTPTLIDNLGQLVNWIIETEQAKASFSRGLYEPTPLISLLGGMGIYGQSYLDKVPVDD